MISVNHKRDPTSNIQLIAKYRPHHLNLNVNVFLAQHDDNKCYFFVMKSITNIKQPIEVTETYCFLSQINIIGNFILAREIENGSTVPNHQIISSTIIKLCNNESVLYHLEHVSLSPRGTWVRFSLSLPFPRQPKKLNSILAREIRNASKIPNHQIISSTNN